MWVVRTVLVLLLLLLVVGFAYNNTGVDQKVAVYLEPAFSNYVDVPMLTVVFWAFAGGAVLSMLFFISMYLKLSVQSRGARKRIKALESEVAILRNRPIEDSVELLKGADRKSEATQSPFAEK